MPGGVAAVHGQRDGGRPWSLRAAAGPRHHGGHPKWAAASAVLDGLALQRGDVERRRGRPRSPGVAKAITPFPAATAGGRRRSSPPTIHRHGTCEGNMAGLKCAFQGDVCV